MRRTQIEKCPTIAGSGISENIHIDGVNDLKVITQDGEKHIGDFLQAAMVHHQELIKQFHPLDANDYPELDYSLHKSLMLKEFRLEHGGEHGGEHG